MAIVFVEIDLAKNVFALHGVDEAGRAALVRPSVARDKLHSLVAALPPCTVAMEACSEGDTVMGSDQRHCVLTLVERVTGYLVIKKLTARSKEQAARALSQALFELSNRCRTITLDNGTEFHDYAAVEAVQKVKFYFCTPDHSWERGTNENTNGLIRQYLPKGSCFRLITQSDCDEIANNLNNRPRERLGFRTPSEAFARS